MLRAVKAPGLIKAAAAAIALMGSAQECQKSEPTLVRVGTEQQSKTLWQNIPERDIGDLRAEIRRQAEESLEATGVITVSVIRPPLEIMSVIKEVAQVVEGILRSRRRVVTSYISRTEQAPSEAPLLATNEEDEEHQDGGSSAATEMQTRYTLRLGTMVVEEVCNPNPWTYRSQWSFMRGE